MNWQETSEQIEKERTAKLIQACKEYVATHSPYDSDDFFTDHFGTIKILRISFEINFINPTNPPKIKYYGIELRKDLQPKKNGAHRWAYLKNEQK